MPENTSHKGLKALIIVLTAGILLISPAEAASVVNLARTPQRLDIQIQGGWQQITIAPGGVWSSIHQATVRYGDRETLIESTEEWAIWDDGTFGPQIDTKKARGNVFR
jgi:hypothetical protein